MKFLDRDTQQLPLMGGVVQRQRLVVPAEVIRNLPTFRHACRLAWKLRFPRNLTYSGLASVTTLYTSHVSDYFSARLKRRELPASKVAETEAVIGNTVMSQWLAYQADLTVLEELQATRRIAA